MLKKNKEKKIYFFSPWDVNNINYEQIHFSFVYIAIYTILGSLHWFLLTDSTSIILLILCVLKQIESSGIKLSIELFPLGMGHKNLQLQSSYDTIKWGRLLPHWSQIKYFVFYVCTQYWTEGFTLVFICGVFNPFTCEYICLYMAPVV